VTLNNGGADLLLLYGSDWTVFGFGVASDQLSVYLGSNDKRTNFSNTGLTPNSVITPDQFKVVNTSSFTTSYSERFIYNQENGKLFFDADGNGFIPPIEIITFPDLPSLFYTNISSFDSSFNTNSPQSVFRERFRGKTRSNIRSKDSGGSRAIIRGDEGANILIGDAGDDQFVGFKGDDFLDGKQGNDRINGGEGKDKLLGGQGRDRLLGGLGGDTLIGGKGADLFILEKGGGMDQIMDYNDKQDWIGLRPSQSALGKTIRLRDLKITQKGRNAMVSLGNENLATLVGVNSKQLQRSDFLLININPGLPSHC
jgi:Ca2+-binding RTX toxin-like protein